MSTTDADDHGLALVFGPDRVSAAAGRTAMWLATVTAGLFLLVAATDLGDDVDAALVTLALAGGVVLGAWVAGRWGGLLFTGLVVGAPLIGAAGAYVVAALFGTTAAIPDVRPWAPAAVAAGYLLVGTALAFGLGRVFGLALGTR